MSKSVAATRTFKNLQEPTDFGYENFHETVVTLELSNLTDSKI
jgi:hypothetical protein